MKPEDVIEITAPSIEEAIIIGLTRLVATRDEVNIEVVDEGNRGFLGIGNRTAKVRLTRRPVESKPEPAKPAPSVLDTVVLPIAQLEATVSKAEGEPKQAPKPVAPATVAEDVLTTPIPVTLDKQDEGVAYPFQEDVEAAVLQVASEILTSLQVRAEMEWREEDRPTIWVDIRGKDADSLVGPRAQTLDSLQYLFRTLTHRLVDGDYNVVVDADGYRMRRRRSLETLARKQADKAVETGRTVRLRSMPAHERRVIHMLLREDDRVETESYGSGRDRAVSIIPVRD